MNTFMRTAAIALALATGLGLAGCATGPGYYGNQGYPQQGYQQQGYYPQQGYGQQGYARCQGCGVVQDVQPVQVSGGDSSGGVLGAVIGAVAGGVLGSTIGRGDGRKAATVVGALAGGAIGNQVGQQSGTSNAWRIVVQMNNGQYATVTQRENPGVRNGDYVQIINGHVYTMQ